MGSRAAEKNGVMIKMLTYITVMMMQTVAMLLNLQECLMMGVE